MDDVKDADSEVVAVAGNEFKFLGLDEIVILFKYGTDDTKVLLDAKGFYKVADIEVFGMKWWRL